MDGLFNIYKEEKMTSHDVVASVRKILKTKAVGHTGTLDPNATGVLPIAVGRATKVIEYMEHDDKKYLAELSLGIVTDTEDIWGNILTKNELTNFDLSDSNIKSVLKSFVGRQNQIPPMYSAIKINGKKLYELARSGIEVERKDREIEIYDISNININLNKVSFLVHCSKGTYIRTLCKDIGEKLGCGATMSKLERVSSGRFNKDTAIRLCELEKNPQKFLIDLEVILKKFPIIYLINDEAKRYINGVKFFVNYADGKYRVYINDRLYGIGNVENGYIKSEKKITL